MRIGKEYAAKTLCKAVQACYNFSVYTEDGTDETTGRSCMENKLIRSKYFLYLTEFFAGMSVMAVELGASRLMAPYFSSSQIVWTVIIGVIMIAMAIGNVWGGKLADRSATPDKLYRRLIIAAIWIALIPFVGRYLIAGISLLLALFVTKNFLVWAALAACLVIFAFPCVLLGTVTPSLTRFTVDNLDDTGKTVGRLNALNTIGSIIGTFVPTFVTIPAVGTAATFLIFSGVLAAIGIAYFVFEKKKSVPGIISGFTMVFVPAVSTFYISQKMGSAGTTLIGDVIESQFKAAYNPNLGAALSLVLMVMVLVCVAVMNRFSDGEEVATI